MTATTRNRLVLVGALLVAGGGLAFVAYGNLGKNLVYYWSPGEMLGKGAAAYGPTVRLGGIVQDGSIKWDDSHTKLSFRVADGKEPNAPFVTVASDQVPPQMFREGIGCVVEGTFDSSKVFTAQRLMVKHSNEYRPPKEGEQHDHDWKKSLADDTAAASRSP
jgi:cytochrome c-type biogenesis protein CcmE